VRVGGGHRRPIAGGRPDHIVLILVDTSVWIDHLRKEDAGLRRLLESALLYPG
jgi:hypothetical protein